MRNANQVTGKNKEFEYVFPAIKGIQAKREYYVSMCPLRLIPKIFLFDEEELVPELRAQRILNKNRIPEITRYVVENRKSYVFSALTASVDAVLRFNPHEDTGDERRLGLLHIPMSATFIINDGQHRRAAIEAALRECPDLADETIAVVFFTDVGLKRCQQMFADLNRYAVKPAKSLGILYDHGDDWAEISRQVVRKSKVFKDVVEMEKTTLAARSKRLFTLSAIHGATRILLSDDSSRSIDDRIETAIKFWEEIDRYIPEWGLVRSGKITSGDVRQDYIHSHGVVLSALARVGNAIIKGSKWKAQLKGLDKINWSRSEVDVWGGRVTTSRGRILKGSDNIVLASNVIKAAIKVPLTPEEQRLEDSFDRSRYD